MGLPNARHSPRRRQIAIPAALALAESVRLRKAAVGRAACSARPKRWQATALQDCVEWIVRAWNGAGLLRPLRG